MRVRASCVFLVYLKRRLHLVTSMLKWGLSLTVPCTCSYASNHRNDRRSIQIVQVCRIFWKEQAWSVEDEDSGALTGRACCSPLTWAPDGGFCRKCFPTKKSSNGFPNFWLLSKTGFLSQLIEHKLQLTLEGLTCILGSSQLNSYLGAFWLLELLYTSQLS